jgi:hypothetical protein
MIVVTRKETYLHHETIIVGFFLRKIIVGIFTIDKWRSLTTDYLEFLVLSLSLSGC